MYAVYVFDDLVEAVRFFRRSKGDVLGYARVVTHGEFFFVSTRSAVGSPFCISNTPTGVPGFKGVLGERVAVTVLKELEDELGVPDSVEIYWLYWEPAGDEAMLGYVMDKTIVEETSNWQAFLALMDMNPDLRRYNLGSSDTSADVVLVIDRRYRNAFVLSKSLTDLLVMV